MSSLHSTNEKLRLREERSAAPGHSVSKCQGRNYNPSLLSHNPFVPLPHYFNSWKKTKSRTKRNPLESPVLPSTPHKFSFLHSSWEHRAREGLPGCPWYTAAWGPAWGCGEKLLLSPLETRPLSLLPSCLKVL